MKDQKLLYNKEQHRLKVNDRLGKNNYNINQRLIFLIHDEHFKIIKLNIID